MTRFWTCRKCRERNPRVKQLCPVCGTKRPKARVPAHRAALDLPYEWWVDQFGEQCGICGATPKTRRLHRDHSHSGPDAGRPRGILCFQCNTALPSRVDAAWLRAAADYLERSVAA